MKAQWYPSPYMLAQIGHGLSGGLAVLAPVAWTGKPIWGLAGMGVVGLYMTVKEFTFDLWVEKDKPMDSWRDMFWFGVGIASGWISLFISK